MDFQKNNENSWLNSFDEVEWKEVIDYLKLKGQKVTNNSILLSKKIYEQTGIMVYPIVFRTYASAGMLANGAFSWTMYQKNGKEVGSIDTVKTCLRKDKKLVVDTSWKDIEIFAEDAENDKS